MVENVAYQEVAGVAFGVGIQVNEGGATIERCFISGAADSAILVRTEASLPSSTLTLKHSRIEGTTGVDGVQGAGIAATGPSITLDVSNTWIGDVSGAGILVSGGKADIRETVVSGVAKSALSRGSQTAGNDSAPISDGLLFHGGESEDAVTLSDCWFEGYEDAGVVLSTMAHELTRVRATGGKVGLALQDGASAEVTECDFSGNSAAEQLEDADAPLPP